LLAVDNPEACFYARMRAIFMENHTTLMARLDMLERSTAIGRDVAAFVLSLVLHKSNSGANNDNIAQRWLRKVKVIK
jgi:aspartate/methionine/tyrosine aminotransferase